MKNYFATGCLGVTPRGGCMVTAVCMMLVCIMHIVFETGHLRNFVTAIDKQNTSSTLKNQAKYRITICSYTTISMLGLSIIVCFVLLVSAYKNLYKGVLLYVGWSVLFEVAHIIILVLIHFETKNLIPFLNVLQWLGLAFRLALQAFYSVYIATYVWDLTESRGKLLVRRRRVSKKRKAKSLKTPPALKFAVKEDA